MNLIVAVTKDYAIGKNNNLLFHLPSDLAYFKKTTTGKVVIFGERTFLSLPKRPLPNRINIVLSDNPNFVAEGATVVHNLPDLFQKIKKFDDNEIFVCGGASIYNLMMPYCKTAYITMIDKIVPADTYIKDITKEGYVLQSETEKQTENGIDFTFQIYKNKNIKKYKN